MLDADNEKEESKSKLYKYFILKFYHRDEYINKKKDLLKVLIKNIN